MNHMHFNQHYWIYYWFIGKKKIFIDSSKKIDKVFAVCQDGRQ